MLVHENNWEECYHYGSNNYEIQSDEFKAYDIVEIYKRHNVNDLTKTEVVINTTGFNKVHQIDWTILNISKSEFQKIKEISINKISKKIEMLEDRIQIISNVLNLNRQVNITISTNQKTQYYQSDVIGKIRTKNDFGYENFSDNWRTQVTIKMSLLDMILKGIVHSNNHYEDDYGFISYTVQTDTKTKEFFKSHSWSSHIWRMSYDNAELNYYKKMLKQVQKVTYDDL